MRSARGCCRSKACDAAAIRARVEEIRLFAGPSLPILPITFGDDVDAKDCGQRLQFEGVEDAPLVLGYSGESAGAQMFVADMWGNAEVQGTMSMLEEAGGERWPPWHRGHRREQSAARVRKSPRRKGSGKDGAAEKTPVPKKKTAKELESDKVLEKSRALRTEGNQCFKAKDFEGALRLYSQALAECPESEQEERSTIFSNLAIMRSMWQKDLELKSKEKGGAPPSADVLAKTSCQAIVDDCNQCLALDRFNVKALKKRAEVLWKHVEESDKKSNHTYAMLSAAVDMKLLLQHPKGKAALGKDAAAQKKMKLLYTRRLKTYNNEFVAQQTAANEARMAEQHQQFADIFDLAERLRLGQSAQPEDSEAAKHVDGVYDFDIPSRICVADGLNQIRPVLDKESLFRRPDVHVGDDCDDAMALLAERVARLSRKAISARGKFTLALGGEQSDAVRAQLESLRAHLEGLAVAQPAAAAEEDGEPAAEPLQLDKWHVFFTDAASGAQVRRAPPGAASSRFRASPHVCAR